ncbi:hypothetical protein PACTADRAFT_33408 [Pachysolen tannophilus NRRL Y-2460]|uniref:VLRF1 domain-containing protein n=1 Tax=Pachysolen tannophilus NRRL Y-2460 TaxID=669874 RepID=A0A1E4TWU5_PACTA|nr:hypothetical protein PACTADRAFT_33408 [Pachysolen tannophilus NRRL Y-2460]
MSKIKKENISQFQSNELYIYHLSRDVLNSLELLYFDSLTTEAISPNSIVSLTSKSLEQHNEQLMDNEQSQAISNVCQTCGSKLDGLDVKKSHYKSDFHRFNLKRKLQKVPPVSEAEFDKIIQDLDESISGSDSSSQEDDNDSYDDDKEKRNLETIFEKTDRSLNNLSIQDNEQSVHYLNTKSPFVLFKSSLLSPERCFGIYKSSFDVTELHSNPLEALKNWNSVDQSKKYSALFMIGGGHFAGAIISHNPKPVKGNINGSSGESLLEQSVNIIEHKTFHRYTTRRKQGGSQGTNDNSNGKANSAGSSLRRYNEAALEKEVRELLNSWKNYLINCESIFIRANGALNRNILVGY